MRRGHPASMSCLIAFECVARHGGVSRAAAELNLTQSAVSRQILQLEAELGAALFKRVRQRLVLTEAGAVYAADVRRILAELADTTYRAMGLGGEDQTLNITVLPTFGARWLVPRLPRFQARWPGVTVNVDTSVIPFDFADSPYDAAIQFGATDWAGAESTFLIGETMVCVCSPAYARALKTERDLQHATLLHQTTRPTAWTNWLEQGDLDLGQAFRGPRFAQFSMVAQAATAGMGVGLIPRFLVEAELAAGAIVTPFARSLATQGAYYVASPETRSTKPLVRAFVAWVAEEAQTSARLE
ncbi:LysR family transcriptional regulator [Phenylobacterium immobile]|uniref:LysR family transcriptional regulator n=1 Tax=Phenylobacterium immobile TaxID=21 RepID=UPI000A98C5FD|nr:LysR family transcriptional regulator [Phenylobacterium immobile]